MGMREKNIEYASAALSVPIVPAAWLAQPTEKQERYFREICRSSSPCQVKDSKKCLSFVLALLLSVFYYQSSSYALFLSALCCVVCASMLPRRSFCVCLGPPSLSHAT